MFFGFQNIILFSNVGKITKSSIKNVENIFQKLFQVLRKNNLTSNHILEYCRDDSIVNISQLISGDCNNKIDWKQLENLSDLTVSSKFSSNNETLTIFINKSNGNHLRIIQTLNSVNKKFTIIIENKIKTELQFENDYDYDDHLKWMDDRGKIYQFEQILILKPKLLALINQTDASKGNEYFCLINLDDEHLKCNFQ